MSFREKSLFWLRYTALPLVERHQKRLIGGFLALIFLCCLGVFLQWWRWPWSRPDAYSAVPSNSPLFFEKPKGDTSLSLLNNASYGTALWQTAPLQSWKEGTEQLEGLLDKLREARWLSVVQADGDGYEWLYLFDQLPPNLSQGQWLKTLPQSKIRQTLYKSTTIHELNDSLLGKWNFAQLGNIILVSRQAGLVEVAIKQYHAFRGNIWHERNFRRVHELQNHRKGWKIFVNLYNLALLTNIGLKPEWKPFFEQLEKIGNWAGCTAQFSTENWVLTGDYYPNAQRLFWKNLAQQTQPQTPSDIAQYLPSNLALLNYFRIADLPNFYRNLGSRDPDFETYFLPWMQGEMAYFITEPTDRQLQADKFLLVRVRDSSLAAQKLAEYGAKFGELSRVQHQNFELIQLSSKDPFASLFGPWLQPLQQPFYTQVGDCILFGNSASVFKIWIEQYNTGRTFTKLAHLQPFAQSIARGYNAYFLIQHQNAAGLFSTLARADWQSLIEARLPAIQQLSPIGLGLSSYRGRFQLTLTGSHFKGQKPRQSQDSSSTSRSDAQVAWRYELKAEMAGAASVVSLERNRKMVFVQDQNKLLYALDQSGRLQWEMPLDGPLLSPVQTIDVFDNNTQQLAFNTAKSIYILDPNGQELKRIRLVSTATNALAVLDYGRGARLFVACKNGQIYGFEPSGKPIMGWNPLGGSSQQALRYLPDPQKNDKEHIILLNNKGSVYSYQRGGQRNFSVACEGAQFLDTDPRHGRIVAGNKAGKITVINLNGKHFSIKAPEKGEGYRFAYRQIWGDDRAEFIRLLDRQLWIEGYEGEKLKTIAQYQFEQAPDWLNAFESPWPCVAALDRKAQKIYLIEPNTGQLAQGFPLEGNTPFVLEDLFSEGQKVLLVGLQNTLIAYKPKLN